MEVALIRVRPDGKTNTLTLKRERTVFGREAGCDVRVPSPEVSRRHCEVDTSGVTPKIRDLGSSNGTFVNQEKIEDSPLNPGDLVSFGGFVFAVVIDGEPEDVNAMLAYEDGLPAAAKRPPSGRAAAASKPLLDSDESSMMDFDFDLSDKDDQPPL